MNIFKRISLVFRYGDEIEKMLKNERIRNEQAERVSRKNNLKLCYEHRQEQNRSHFSESNCDYCKLLKKREIL